MVMGSLSRHMGRYVSWLANAGLLVLCCFLVANTTNAVLASWLDAAPEPAEFAVSVAPAVDRSWEARERILERNLFNSSTLETAAEPQPIEEDIEATKLPLQLLGTVGAEAAALPSLVNADHVVSQVLEAGGHAVHAVALRHQRVDGLPDGGLVEVLVEGVPAAPAHRRRSSLAVPAGRKRSGPRERGREEEREEEQHLR